jgi:hypothetical protein
MDTKELLKMEAQVKAAREKVKDDLMAKADGVLRELREIGFDYEIVTAKKIGRPKKEMKIGEG